MIYWKNAFAFPESNRYAQNFEYMFVFVKNNIKTANIFKVATNESNQIKNKSSCYRTKDGKTEKMTGETGKCERNKENIWIYEVGYQKSTKDDVWKHPAIFPEKLARDHILSWSNKNDIIFDPFSGSGTTCKMAYRYDRKYFGIEISEEYVKLSRERLKVEQSQMRLEL